MKSDNFFAAFFSILFLIIGILTYEKSIFVSYIFFSLSLLLILIYLLFKEFLSKLNIIWLKFSKLFGFYINFPIIFCVYILIIFPFSLIYKLLGNDPLNLKSKKKTNWIYFEKKEISFKDQF